MSSCVVRASRVAHAEDQPAGQWYNYKPDMRSKPDPVAKQLVEANCGDPIVALQYAQVRSEEHLDPRVLEWALFFEHHSSHNQDMVSTPPQSFLSRFFSGHSGTSMPALDELRVRFEDQGRRAVIQPIFGPIRSREWTLLNFHRDNVYTTVLARIQPSSRPTSLYPGEASQIYSDYEVTHAIICDPYSPPGLNAADQAAARAVRRNVINLQLFQFFRQGCIYFHKNSPGIRRVTMGGLLPEREAFNTGSIAYGISVELLARLRTLAWNRRYAGPGYVEDFSSTVFAPFNQEYSYQKWLSQMRGAIASRAVELSEHRTRIAVEIPSSNATHRHDLLNPAVTGHGSLPDLPDERIVGATDSMPHIFLDITVPPVQIGPISDFGSSNSSNGDSNNGGSNGSDGGSDGGNNDNPGNGGDDNGSDDNDGDANNDNPDEMDVDEDDDGPAPPDTSSVDSENNEDNDNPEGDEPSEGGGTSVSSPFTEGGETSEESDHPLPNEDSEGDKSSSSSDSGNQDNGSFLTPTYSTGLYDSTSLPGSLIITYPPMKGSSSNGNDSRDDALGPSSTPASPADSNDSNKRPRDDDDTEDDPPAKRARNDASDPGSVPVSPLDSNDSNKRTRDDDDDGTDVEPPTNKLNDDDT